MAIGSCELGFSKLGDLAGNMEAARVTLLLGIIIVGLFSWTIVKVEAEASLQPHSPIFISGNAGFTSANGVTQGSGTASDPYVIEGWDIDASTATGIDIRNTQANFVIRNVSVHSETIRHVGLVLSGVINGRVEMSKFLRGYTGISIGSSSGIVISDNEISGNSGGPNFDAAGLGVGLSTNITIIGNNVTRNNRYGLWIGSSSNVTIKGNVESYSAGIASVGVWIQNSDKFTVTENTVSYNTHMGMLLQNSTMIRVNHNRFIGNYPSAQDLGSENSWDDGYPSGGNYWADYGYFSAVDNCSGPNQNVCPDPDGIGDTPYVLQTGQQDRYPLAVHDVAATTIEAPNSVVRGKTISVNVTIQNQGNVIERAVTVSVLFDGTLIDSQTVADFAPGEVLMSFSWVTGVLLQTGVPPGTYVITAAIGAVPLETDASDNARASSNMIEVIGFPQTPLPYLEGIGFLLTSTSETISLGLVIVLTSAFLILRLRARRK